MARRSGINSKIFKAQAEKGFSLIETLVSLAIIAIIAVGFLISLASGIQGVSITDERQTAISIAEHQMEYVKKTLYASSYLPDTIPAEYAGYSVAINTNDVTGGDGNIQKIQITVSYQGEPIIMNGSSTLECYKLKQW
jgi:prepilin-type N-terminal cleavage/methylation domain-containing protein